MSQSDNHSPTKVSTHETPYGTFRVSPSSGTTIMVCPEKPPGYEIVPREFSRAGMSSEQLRRLSSRPRHVPATLLLEREFRVVKTDDGGLDVKLEAGQPRTSVHPAYALMASIAAAYARENVELMDAIRVKLRADAIEELEATAAGMPDPDTEENVIRWRGLVKEGVAALPEPWRGLVRDHGASYEGLRAAPAPLGPLVLTGLPADEQEHRVLLVVDRIRTIEWYVASANEEKARHLRVATKLRIRSEREADAAPAPAFR